MTADQLESRIALVTSEIVAARGAVAVAVRKQDAARDAMDLADATMGKAASRLTDKETERAGLEYQLAQLKGAAE